jgi:hypothetical protein
MAWFVVLHRTGGIGCVSDDALELHLMRGWEVLTGELSEDARAQFSPADWAEVESPTPTPVPDADEVSTEEEPDDPAETEE